MGNISDYFMNYAGPLAPSGWSVLMFSVLILWSVIWKGIALWKSGRLNQKGWFIVLLIVNTLGILEIIYIFAVARRKETSQLQAPPRV